MEVKGLKSNITVLSWLRLRGKDKFMSDDLMRAREILAVIAKGLE